MYLSFGFCLIVLKMVPFKGNLVNARKEKKKRCHWCGTKEFGDLISCLSCEREFFCVVCIEKRYLRLCLLCYLSCLSFGPSAD